jgi:1,4-alpha-glucan branching enzyme
VVVLNFTPVPRTDYRLGVPRAGRYKELLNSDSRHYGGTEVGNLGHLDTEPLTWMGQPCSLRLTLPPLAGIVLAPESGT